MWHLSITPITSLFIQKEKEAISLLFIYLLPSLVHTLKWKVIKLIEASKLLPLHDFAL